MSISEVVSGSTDVNGSGLTKTGNLDVALQWDAPITRLVERNNYRRILINYEQKKRAYYQYEDGIWQVLRAEIRQLMRDRLAFEYGRKSVGIAADQIELNADLRDLREAQANGGSNAGVARDTIQALSALLQAQNGLLNVYVNYETVRRNLDFDLGTMELTPEGLWIDPGENFSGNTSAILWHHPRWSDRLRLQRLRTALQPAPARTRILGSSVSNQPRRTDQDQWSSNRGIARR